MGRAGLLTIAALTAYSAPAVLAYSPAARLVGVRRRIRARDRVALTFDDGPQIGATEHFLDLLQRLGVRATFFLVGEQVSRSPHLARAIRSAGHEVANHGYRHANHFFRNPLQLGDDLRRGADAIEEAIGERPALFRPPYGAVTPATLAAARRQDSEIVLWTAWGRDWRERATTDTITRDALRGVSGGGILLLHDADYYGGRTWHATFEAVPRIVDGIRRRGLSVGSIGGRSGLAP